MTPEPWFSNWNYGIMQLLFGAIPHNATTDTAFDSLSRNHLASTWIFAAVFYVFWSIQDSRTPWRRSHLFQIIVAFGIAVLISLVVRPWIAWPAPVLNPRFQGLYPAYFWSNKNFNSFPSHSTLAYFMVAVGLWPLSKRATVWLSFAVLLLVSLPRVYLGGHYPIDVVASLMLVIVVLEMVWCWDVPTAVVRLLVEAGPAAVARELLLILWVFELGEGFRGITYMVLQARRYFF
jgi:undecaprenyl-diphosphatase